MLHPACAPARQPTCRPKLWQQRHSSMRCVQQPRCPTCLVDLDDAAVCHLLQQPQQRGLIVPQPGALVVGTDVVDPDRPPRDGGAHQALPEALRAAEAQHGRWCWRWRRARGCRGARGAAANGSGGAGGRVAAGASGETSGVLVICGNVSRCSCECTGANGARQKKTMQETRCMCSLARSWLFYSLVLVCRVSLQAARGRMEPQPCWPEAQQGQPSNLAAKSYALHLSARLAFLADRSEGRKFAGPVHCGLGPFQGLITQVNGPLGITLTSITSAGLRRGRLAHACWLLRRRRRRRHRRLVAPRSGAPPPVPPCSPDDDGQRPGGPRARHAGGVPRGAQDAGAGGSRGGGHHRG